MVLGAIVVHVWAAASMPYESTGAKPLHQLHASKKRLTSLRACPAKKFAQWVKEASHLSSLTVRQDEEDQGLLDQKALDAFCPWRGLEFRKPPHRDPSCFKTYFSAENKRLRLWEAMLIARFKVSHDEDGVSLTERIHAWNLLSYKQLKEKHHAFRQTHEKRRTHRRGLVALVRLERDASHPSPFTGIFAGDVLGIMRASDVGLSDGVLPAVGLRCFLANRAQNVSLLALHSWDKGNSDKSFLSYRLTTVLEQPKSILPKICFHAGLYLLDQELFQQKVRLDLTEAASWTINGDLVKEPVVPFFMDFVPVLPPSQEKTGDFCQELQSISPGVALYDIYLTGEEGAKAFRWGAMYLESPFIASYLGDRMVFPHEMIDSPDE